MEARTESRLVRAAPWVAMGFLFLVFLKNAWVCDDAYISFRSIEQVFAGNGPRWNPQERVQVFTSPLWFWTLCALRLVSHDVFANAIVASAACFAATLIVIQRTVRHFVLFVVVLALLVASNGFFDYTSSGLENPLAFLALSWFLSAYFAISKDDARRGIRRLLFATGLVLLCRFDLLPLVAPAVLRAWDRNRGEMTRRGWVRTVALTFSPLFVWGLFALVYYGTVVPNPAWAKLATGIAPLELWRKGALYMGAVAAHDPVTVLTVVAGALALLSSHRGQFVALGAGAALEVLYVVGVGGDFMLGRFLSAPFLVVVVSLAVLVLERPWVVRTRVIAALALVLVVYWFAWPHTPVNSPLVHRADPPDANGFADERGIYNRASLWRYLTRIPGDVFPDTKWAHDGVTLRDSPICCTFAWSMGYYGYWAGTDKRIIDLFAVCDPLLARLPVTGTDWRVGHYSRRLPEGYLETVHHGTNMIVDPDLHAFYDRVVLVTQDTPLFSPRRMRAIVAWNLPR